VDAPELGAGPGVCSQVLRHVRAPGTTTASTPVPGGWLLLEWVGGCALARMPSRVHGLAAAPGPPLMRVVTARRSKATQAFNSSSAPQLTVLRVCSSDFMCTEAHACSLLTRCRPHHLGRPCTGRWLPAGQLAPLHHLPWRPPAGVWPLQHPDLAAAQQPCQPR